MLGMVNECTKNYEGLLDNFFIRIADIVYEIVNVDPTLKINIEGATQKFLVHEATPDVTIETRWDDLSAMKIRSKKVFDSGAIWQLYNYNEKYLFSFTTPALGSIPYKMAIVNKDFSRGEVLLHRTCFDTDQPKYPLEYPLDELLFINFLALGKGVEVHACGIIDSNEKGHLFIGQSGAGKTTMARLWQDEPGVTVLSDDRIVLRKVDKSFWMHGTPWHGEAELASPARDPLTRIYFLKHGQKNEIVRQGATDAIGRLFACSFLPFYSSEALDFTLGFFEEVVKTIPCYELRFVPDERVVEFFQGKIE